MVGRALAPSRIVAKRVSSVARSQVGRACAIRTWSKRGRPTGRDADRYDAMGIGIRTPRDDGEGRREIISIALEVVAEHLAHAIDPLRLWTLGQPEAAAYHRHGEPAAMGKVAGLRQQ